ncbi:MAG: YdcF family protein [Cyanobacteriota bacterium]|nr:YdcF family protein [Cyanobacteriota bacterium]
MAAPRKRPPQPKGRKPRRKPRRKLGRTLVLVAAGATLIWLSRGWWWPAPPQPQMILVLGGDVAREQAAAELARQQGLPVVVSGGSNPEYAHWLFGQREGLPQGQVLLDYRAQDTVSNFTSLVDDLRRARIRHALLVTSSDHMERALLVGRIVAGSRGIALTPVPVSCGGACQREPRRKLWFDALRSGLWVVSGQDIRGWAADHLPPWLGGVAGARGPGSGPAPAGR